jgi:hypothetical protein
MRGYTAGRDHTEMHGADGVDSPVGADTLYSSEIGISF